MRKYLSLYELFNKSDEYFILKFINRKVFRAVHTKARFISRLEYIIYKFKIIKFQNDRKAKIIVFDSINSNKIIDNRTITLPKFKKRSLLNGLIPMIKMWYENNYDYTNHYFSCIVKNKKNLFKFFLENNFELNNVQKYWLKEYLKIINKKNHRPISIKIKKL